MSGVLLLSPIVQIWSLRYCELKQHVVDHRARSKICTEAECLESLYFKSRIIAPYYSPLSEELLTAAWGALSGQPI